MNGNVVIVSTAMAGVETGGTVLLFKAPAAAYGGGITIVEGHVTTGGTATTASAVLAQIVKLSSAGTPAVNGTIVATHTATGVESRVPSEMTIASGYVSADEWVGVIVGGTVPARWFIDLAYVMGK